MPTLPMRFTAPIFSARRADAGHDFALPEGQLEEADPFEQMAVADAADASLLRLVLCAASATLVLALAASLV